MAPVKSITNEKIERINPSPKQTRNPVIRYFTGNEGQAESFVNIF